MTFTPSKRRADAHRSPALCELDACTTFRSERFCWSRAQQATKTFAFDALSARVSQPRWTCDGVQVLESLLCENDEAPHTWYLLALAHYGGGDFDAAFDTLEHGTRFMQALPGEAHADAQELYHELRERIREGQALVGDGT